MLMIQLIRFFRGTVEFTVRDGFPERFINLCAQNRIPIWGGARSGGDYTARTTLRGSKALPALAQKAGVTFVQGKGRGVPVLLGRYRRRTGLFAGLVMVGVALVVMGSFIWQIQVVGPQTIPMGEVTQVLEELGVRRGVLRRSIDTREVERLLMLRLDKVAWAAVNLRGSTAVVEIQERVVPPVRIDDQVPHNVVAKKPGYITYLEVYNGQPTVKVGDSVDAGEILVSGIMEDKKGRNRTVHARAKVVAQSQEHLSVSIPLRQEKLVPSGVTVRRYLNILSVQLPLFWGHPVSEPYKAECARFRIPVLSDLAPITWSRENYLLLRRESEEITQEAARVLAQQQLEQLEKTSFAGMTILERSLNGQELPDRFLLEAVYLCQGDISVEKEILSG